MTVEAEGTEGGRNRSWEAAREEKQSRRKGGGRHVGRGRCAQAGVWRPAVALSLPPGLGGGLQGRPTVRVRVGSHHRLRGLG